LTGAPGRPTKDGAKILTLTADKLRERDASETAINMRSVPSPIVGPYGQKVRDELGDEQTTLIMKPTKADLARAKTVKDVGLAAIEKNGSIEYKAWRDLHGLKSLTKSQFDTSVSFCLTYPGQWGIMRGLEPGTFVKAERGVENEW